MSKKAELLALAAGVEAGTGRDLSLSRAIAKAVAHVPQGADLLTSIDSVEALRQRLLPGSHICVNAGDSGIRADIYGPITITGEARTEARARLAAILRVYAIAIGNGVT